MTGLYTSTDQFVILPALLLVIFGCAILLFDLFPQSRRNGHWLLAITLAGFAFTGYALWLQQRYLDSQSTPQIGGFHGTILVDRFSIFFNVIFLIAALVVSLSSFRYLERKHERHGEYYGLILLAQAGMYFLATGMDLITLFIGTELMSLCFYIAVGFLRADKRSNEAALKYLLLGGFSSALLVYGFSLLYGISGSTTLRDIAAAVAQSPNAGVLFVAIATITSGLAFKIAGAPFHAWAPDAYEGAPTPITAYLASASKAASFAFLLRILLAALPSARAVWAPMIAGIAVTSIVAGNLAAISQHNLKRLLAYSSIAHTGYILLGVVAGNAVGLNGVAVYIFVYAFMTLGAFVILSVHGGELEDLAGLMQRSPASAILMTIFLLSLAGIPPTAGFIGKYFILEALIETGHPVLACVGALYIVVSLYYYFRIVRVMFTGSTSTAAAPASAGSRMALALTGAATLVVGIFPEPFVQFARASLFR